MKILMLTPYLPFPLISGGQIRSYNLLKNLGKKHQITLVSLIKHDDEKKHIPAIASFCEKVIVSHRPEKPWTFANIIKTGFGQYPFLVVRNFSQEARQTVEKLLKQESFDLIHAETFYVMPHIPKTSTPVLLVEQTIEYLVYQHYVETMRFFPLKLLLSLDVFKIRYWEHFYWKKAQRVVAMSESDKKIMRKEVESLDVSIVPNGVDCSFFTFHRKVTSQSPTILFVGNFRWLQNKEAVIFLIKKIWPLIQKKLPQAKLWIVGKYPSEDILKLKTTGIEISEGIDDIRQAYAKSDLLLAPIYGPGGTRYKILEAMASGVPVVTTPQGIEGLGVVDGREALVRKNAAQLAEATISVLTNKRLYGQLASYANDLVRRQYNWAVIARSLDQIYETVAQTK